MKCNNCGAEISSFQAYCINCGAKIEQAAAPVPTAAEEAPPAEAAAQAADTAAEPINTAEEEIAAAGAAATGQETAANSTVAAPPVRGHNYRDPFAPQPNEYNNYSESYYGEQPVSMGNWLGTMFLLLLVPLALGIVSGVIGSFVGTNHIVTNIISIIGSISPLIMSLIWAFSRRTKPSKRNFFRALLIFYIIMIVLIVALVLIVLSVYPNIITDIIYLLNSSGVSY